jgi:D-alanyl-D-alanine carboxypeptidase
MKFVLALSILMTTCLANADNVDDLIQKAMSERRIPGCSLAVLKNGRVIKMTSYGEADISTHTKANADTVYEIGSISKQFEAAAIQKLVHDHKLDWDAPISKYVKDLPEDWQVVTLRQLMSHTGGLPDYTSSKFHDEHGSEFATHKRVIDATAAMPIVFAPGTEWSYCNTGSYLCGMAIESVTGKSYVEYTKKNLFEPAKMPNTRLDVTDLYLPTRSLGYLYYENKFKPAEREDPSWPYAGGGILSTIKDMATWEQSLHRREKQNDPDLKELWKPTQLKNAGSYPYGLGWQLADDRDQANIWHTGHIPGFSAVISRFPTQGYTVILLTNADGIDTNYLAREVAATYDPKLTPAQYLFTHPDPLPNLTQSMRDAIAALGNYKTSNLLTAGLAATTTEEIRGQIKASLGAGLMTTFLGEENVSSRHLEFLGSKVTLLRHYRLAFADLVITEGFYFTAEGKLAFFIQE